MTHEINKPNPYRKDQPTITIPIYRATPDNFKEYGRILTGNGDQVRQERWPRMGFWRPLDENTGYNNAVISGDFRVFYDPEHDALCGENKAVGSKANENSCYTIGWYPEESEEDGIIIIDEINNHPDSEQQFIAGPGEGFILLLAKIDPKNNSDNIDLSDLVGFYFEPADQYLTVCVGSYVYHQPPILVNPRDPKNQSLNLRTRQGSIHGCVTFSPIKERGVCLKLKTQDPQLHYDVPQTATLKCHILAALCLTMGTRNAITPEESEQRKEYMAFFQQYDWRSCAFMQNQANRESTVNISTLTHADKITSMLHGLTGFVKNEHLLLLRILKERVSERINANRCFTDDEGNHYLYLDDCFSLFAFMSVICQQFVVDTQNPSVKQIEAEAINRASNLLSYFSVNEPPAQTYARQMELMAKQSKKVIKQKAVECEQRLVAKL